MNNAAKEAVENAETMVKDAQNAFQQAYEQATKSFEEANAFGKDNMEAVVKSGEISTKAAEEFGNKVTEMSKANFDETVKAAQELSSAKTMNELFEKQTSFAKTAFENFTAQVNELNELAQKSSKEAMAPINARVEAAGNMMSSFQA